MTFISCALRLRRSEPKDQTDFDMGIVSTGMYLPDTS